MRRRALLAASKQSGGSKTINYIRMSYVESSPDEYRAVFKADFRPASSIRFEMDGRAAEMDNRTTMVAITMLSLVPTLERLTYSPKEDDTYIYEVIMA